MRTTSGFVAFVLANVLWPFIAYGNFGVSAPAHMGGVTSPGGDYQSWSPTITTDSSFTGGTLYIWSSTGHDTVGDVTFGTLQGSGTIAVVIGTDSLNHPYPVDYLNSFNASGTALPVQLSFYLERDLSADVHVHKLVIGSAGRAVVDAITALDVSGFGSPPPFD